MTDSATAVAAPAGTSADATATAATSGSTAATATDLWAGLQNAESRTWVESKGFKALDPLVESARHADKLQSEITDLKGKALTPPAADAKAEEWDAFYAKIGRPEKPEAYEFKLPEGLPENLPYEAESAAKYKQWSHAAGLSPRQAQMLHDFYVRTTADQFTAYNAATVAKTEGAHGELVKEWGAPDSDGYKANLQFADRFIANNGGEKLLSEMKSNGLLGPTGAVLSPVLANAMAKAGRALYAEDTLVTGQRASEPRDQAKTLYPVDPFTGKPSG